MFEKPAHFSGILDIRPAVVKVVSECEEDIRMKSQTVITSDSTEDVFNETCHSNELEGAIFQKREGEMVCSIVEIFCTVGSKHNARGSLISTELEVSGIDVIDDSFECINIAVHHKPESVLMKIEGMEILQGRRSPKDLALDFR
jgi:hypothetical protein